MQPILPTVKTGATVAARYVTARLDFWCTQLQPRVTKSLHPYCSCRSKPSVEVEGGGLLYADSARRELVIGRGHAGEAVFEVAFDGLLFVRN